MCIYYVAYLVLADQSDTIDHEFSSRITKCESKDEFYARILHDERSRQKRRPRWWSLLNNSSIRRDYGSTIWSPSSDRRRFPLEEPSDFRILDSFGDFITRGWRIKKKGKMHTERARPIGQEKFSTCSCSPPALIPNSVLLRYPRTWSSFFPVPSIRRLDFLFTCWHETFHSLRLKGLSVVGERRSGRSSMQLQTASHRDAIVRRSFARDAFECFVEIRFFFFSFFSRGNKTFVGGYVVR